MSRPPFDGVLVVDKPKGPTSHDVVAAVRRVLQTREVGHAGTLDPMATGVLVVAVGEATKLVAYLTAHDKAYDATVRFGIATASLDADGATVGEAPVAEAVLSALESRDTARESALISRAFALEGERRLQVPPAVSAIKINGVASHALARRGELAPLAPRAVVVRALGLEGARRAPPELDVSLHTGKGYYVRAFARDVAETLGTVGHLTQLRRTQSGPFLLAHAIDGDALMRARRGDETMAAELARAASSVAQAANRALASLVLTDEGAERARHGKSLTEGHWVGSAALDAPCAWMSPSGELVAIGLVTVVDDAPVGRVARGFRGSRESP